MSNDGNAGSGEWRSVAVLQKPTFLTDGDVFQVYGELGADGDPELGTTLASELHLSLSESWALTGSLARAAESWLKPKAPRMI